MLRETTSLKATEEPMLIKLKRHAIMVVMMIEIIGIEVRWLT